MASELNEDGNSVDALELLHEYAWREIFKNVDDPQDLLSLSKTCLSFHNILDPDKWRWGFSLILPHVAPYLRRRRRNPPHLSRNKNWTGLLKLRGISKRWCKAIDDFLSSPHITKNGLNRSLRLVHNFGTTEVIEQFRQRFLNWGKSPFPGGAVEFSSKRWVFQEGDDEDIPDPQQQLFLRREYIRKNSDLVEDFGQHIQSLILRSDSLFGTLNDRHDIIRDLLSNLPNLRSLFLPPRHFVDDFSNLEYAQAANYFRENPLPALPHLEDVELKPGYVKLYDFLIKTYAPQLKRVGSLRLSCATSRALIAEMTLLEHLALKLDLHNLCNIFGVDSTFKHFSNIQSPLHTLDLSLTSRKSKVFYIDKLLQSVRHLPLKSLRIMTLPRVKITIQEYGLPLDAFRNDTIKFFSFKCKQMIMTASFNFLEALSKAEEIEISHETSHEWHKFETPDDIPEEEHPSEVPERIRILPYFYGQGFEGDPYLEMYQSSIWELVTSLKTMSVRASHRGSPDPHENHSFKASYSRNVYDQMNAMNLIEIEPPPQPLPPPTFFSMLKSHFA